MIFKHLPHSPPRLWSCLPCAALVAALLSIAHPAHSQVASSDAERLFNEARNAMQAKDYAVACQKFRESNRVDPALGTLFNLANCEEQRGRVATAWTLFRQVREQLAPEDRRIVVADEHIAELEPRLPHLRIVLAPSISNGTRIRVDSAELEPALLSAPVAIDPGRHQVALFGPGQTEQTRSIELGEGQLRELRVPFEGLPLAPDTREQAVNQRDANPSNSSSTSDDRVLGLDRRAAAYIVGGVGVAGLLVGTIAGIAGLRQESIGNSNCFDATRTCNQKGIDANNAARSLAVVSTVGFAVGLVGVGAGGYLYFSASPRHATANASNPSQSVSVAWGQAW